MLHFEYPKNFEEIDDLENYDYINTYGIKYSSNYLNPNTALNILRAFDYSKYIGTSLTHHITIVFKKNTDVFAGGYIFRNIRNKNTRWNKEFAKRRSLERIPPTWVYVFENPYGHLHVHWALHIPSEQVGFFERKLKTWLSKEQGSEVEDHQVKIDRINPFTDKTLACYFIKGVKPDFIDFFQIRKIALYQGHFIGQRARVSKSIGPTIIKRTGFEARKQRHEWINRHPDIAKGFEKPSQWNLNEVVPQLTGAKSFPGFKDYLQRHNSKYRRRRRDLESSVALVDGYVSNDTHVGNSSSQKRNADHARRMALLEKQLRYSI